jgi:hypothetical protein
MAKEVESKLQLLAYHMTVDTILKYFTGASGIMAKDHHVHEAAHF